MNTLINAKNNYQTLEESDARALIYQKILLAEDNETKIEYLFLLEELFQKANLSEIYLEFLSNKIKEIGIKNIPDKYKEAFKNFSDKTSFGKIKYNDKILHQSRI